MKSKILFLALLVVFFITSVLVFGFSNHIYDSSRKYSYISVAKDSFTSSVTDSNFDTFVGAKGMVPFFVLFDDQNTNVSKISILSELPLRKIRISNISDGLNDVNVYFQDSEAQYPWIYEYRNNLTADNLLISLGDPDSKRELKVKEIAIFSSSNLNFVQSVFKFLFVLPRNVFSYFYYLCLFSIIFGFLFFPIVKKYSGLKDIVSIIVSVSFTVLYFALVGILNIALKQEFLGQVLFVCALILSIRNFLTADLHFNLFDKNLLFIWFMFLCLLTSLNIFLDFSDRGILMWDILYDHQETFTFPYKNYEQDYITSYSSAKVWLHDLKRDSDSANKIMGVNWITDRPPFMSLVPTGLFPSLGERFFIYELIGLFLASLISISCGLFLKKLFNENIAILTTLLFLGNQFLLFFYKLTQAKMIALSFVFLAGYLLFKKHKSHLIYFASMVFTAAYMFQSVAVVFIGIWLFKFKSLFANKKTLLAFVLPICILSGWLVYVRFFNPPTAISSYFWATDYYELVKAQTERKPLVMDFSGQNIVLWLSNKGYNFLSLFIENPHPTIVKTWNSYRNTLVGALGYTVFPLSFLSLFFYYKKYQNATLLIFSSIFLYIFSLGFYNDLGLMFYLCGIVPLIIGFSFHLILEKKLKLLGVLFIIVSMIETFYVNFKLNFYVPIPELKSFWLYSGSEFKFGFVLLVISLISLYLKALYELHRRI